MSLYVKGKTTSLLLQVCAIFRTDGYHVEQIVGLAVVEEPIVAVRVVTVTASHIE